MARRVARVPWPISSSWVAAHLLAAWFAVIDLLLVRYIFLPFDTLGSDGRLYSLAAAAWLAGGDPWAASVNGVYLAAPPPTILPFVLTAWLPPYVAGLVWVVVGAAAGIVTVRALGVPLWWLMFPPLIFAVWHGSIEPVVLLLLVIGPKAFAPILKVYAVVPLIGEGHWRPIVAAAVVVLATAVFLPWPSFLAHLGDIATRFEVYSGGGLSAAQQPILAVGTVIALAWLGRRTAGYLAVPALFPRSLFHYSVIALPILGEVRLVAAAAAVPYVPYLIPMAVIFQAAIDLTTKEMRAESPRSTSLRHPNATSQPPPDGVQTGLASPSRSTGGVGPFDARGAPTDIRGGDRAVTSSTDAD